MDALRGVTVIAATMAMGLIAGVFALYAHTIMPALSRADDRAFVQTFQALDRAIVNPWFMASAFLGALGWTTLAAVLHRGRPAFTWIALALALYLVAVVVTIVVHLPLNDAIKMAGVPTDPAAAATIRAAFHEARWVGWNLVRVLTSVAACGSLCWALVLHGRTQ